VFEDVILFLIYSGLYVIQGPSYLGYFFGSSIYLVLVKSATQWLKRPHKRVVRSHDLSISLSILVVSRLVKKEEEKK
jgi:hypothetical protein